MTEQAVPVFIVDCHLAASGLDLTFLSTDFARENGVRRVSISGLRMTNASLVDLEPFFDGREVVELLGCRECGCPCYPEEGACPEWASVRCVMSS